MTIKTNYYYDNRENSMKEITKEEYTNIIDTDIFLFIDAVEVAKDYTYELVQQIKEIKYTLCRIECNGFYSHDAWMNEEDMINMIKSANNYDYIRTSETKIVKSTIEQYVRVNRFIINKVALDNVLEDILIY